MSKRAIFEEVSSPKAEAAAPAPVRGREARGAIALWLWLLAALVAAMVLVGGLTRLTDSGLSITVWDPVMGAVPPLSASDWEAAFEAYKTTTEYQVQNNWMTLEDFKPIFWWEWGHRFLGRVIGVVWLVGLVGFLVARAVPRGWLGRLVVPGLLGGVQGAVGWWMVASGLTGRLDVASYRLAMHLGLAFVIFMLLVWLAMRIRLDEVEALKARRRRFGGMGWAGSLGALIFLQIIVGALVAGIDAGRGYVDWPLMQGQFLPSESFDLVPPWRNFFENPALVQFCHRMLGYLVLIWALATAVALARRGHPRIRAAGFWLAGGVLAQVVIGIVTVMHGSPAALAIFHQAGALVVVFLLMRTKFALAYPSETRIARGRSR
ncbi:COX15/CtaA family protein [Limibaculum sp. M0105]|uniref:Heme A synthase n=1 Tax=Thermohalobaculum xanthum TaxID=2753746 RepID=A0A8J7M5P4_9RHOB|nr:COX15/CtaA family protein [Thermohalobaculum xanthum]MBK0398981.1 COX15/CtaA family protein [Thermohalobaculum xanthum]